MGDVIRIGILGLGGIGKHACRLLLDHRSGFEIVGAATAEAGDVGKDLHDIVDSDAGSDVVVVGGVADLLGDEPDIVIDATRSFLPEVEGDLAACIDAGANVVSCCEELAYPFVRHPGLAAEIDQSARRNGVTVVGTGVNPGLIFDSLLLLASGVAWDVTGIAGRRVVDVSAFSEAIHRRLGIGFTEPEFRSGHEDGTIAGHVGFPESILMVAEGMGVVLDGPVAERFEPIVARTPAPTLYGEVEAGRTEGFQQIATADADGDEFIRLELLLHLRPEEGGHDIGDSVLIDGEHPVDLRLVPGMDAMQATSAHLVNSVPAVVAAEPGLKTVKDLPIPGAWLGPPGAITFR